MTTMDSKYSDLALLLLRIGVAYIFITHGWGKLTNIEGTAGFFGGLSIPVPIVMAWIVAIVEFFGGILVLLGAYTKVPNLLLAVIMLVAILAQEGNFDLEFLLLISTLVLSLIGSGQYSIDYKIATR